jgi:hypothetical protein
MYRGSLHGVLVVVGGGAAYAAPADAEWVSAAPLPNMGAEGGTHTPYTTWWTARAVNIKAVRVVTGVRMYSGR